MRVNTMYIISTRGISSNKGCLQWSIYALNFRNTQLNRHSTRHRGVKINTKREGGDRETETVSHRETAAYLEVKDVNGCYTGEEDGTSSGETLQNVVSVLDDRRHQQTAQRLQHHHRPHQPGVAEEKALGQKNIER